MRASLSSLTMHDSSHLDGLWTVAGTIAGKDFLLNPLEGYLFGSAVLLHDAALCFEAYSGGRQAMLETVQWKDAYNRRKANQGVNIDAVEFEALRKPTRDASGKPCNRAVGRRERPTVHH